MQEKLINAAKDYASEAIDGGITLNNPKLYKAFRAGQDHALSIASAPALQEEATRLREQVRVLREALQGIVELKYEPGMSRPYINGMLSIATEALTQTNPTA